MGVVISDRNEIELIRKCLHITGRKLRFDFERLWLYEVVYQLGPYKVRKTEYKEIFDISVLGNWITDEENRNAQSSANTP